MALLTAPLHSRVQIFTDSAAAIQVITKCRKGLSTRKWLKTPNSLWVMNIIAMVKEKDLTLELVKVKGHSGDVLNDLADELAKEGGYCNSVLDVPFTATNEHLKFFPCYNNIPLSQKIRRFSTSILRSFICAEWSRLNSQKDTFAHQRIKWSASWTLFRNHIHFRCNKHLKNFSWIFLFKIFHKALPLGDTLKLRKPTLYKDLGCASCKTPTVET